MCGRARLSTDVSEIKLVFSIPPHRPTPNFPPSWNVAPTDPLPVVHYDTKAGECSPDLLRWGLVYLAVWYVLAIVAYLLIGIERWQSMLSKSTKRRPI
jgi:putative SOS response-associated peptidase YedK